MSIDKLAKDISFEIESVKPDEISIVKIRTHTKEEFEDIFDTVRKINKFPNVLFVHVPIDYQDNSLEPAIEFVK